jgi:hypothetical protein
MNYMRYNDNIGIMGGRLWIGLMWLRYGPAAGPWEQGYIKRLDIDISVTCIDMNS